MKISNILSALLLGSIVVFSGCGNNDNSDTVYTYSVKVINLTAGQKMSPILVSSSSLFSVGESASVGLEKLAEGGDNSALLDANSVSGTKAIIPSDSDTVSLNTKTQMLSIASMLVKTNDGFAGLSSFNVSSLAVNGNTTAYLHAYDAGTEANSETSTTVAGIGGEGYNPARETLNMVSVHSGIISKDDGLVSSALTSMERFDNPVAIAVITRTK